MSVPQLAFLAGFAVVLVAVVAFGLLVVVSASRNVGDSAVLTEVVRRLGRAPADRLEAGRWAFYAHRIGGVAIFAFLVLHLGDVALYAVSPALYDDVHALYGSPPLRVFESGLLLAILFHAFNGLRLLAVDLVDVRPLAAYRLLQLTAVVTVVLWLAGSVVILMPIVR
ncbi:MAG TPA: succinate dehydrogenase, cytochrome b556 subunit [Candidatus Limnocylindrales bacterium]